MDLDIFPSYLLEEEAVDVGDDISEAAHIEGERCGICMDIIIDRGVLDCCQHWFCFDCIDNWSTITNLCPLCQCEFQLITCVSVYDTNEGNKVDDDSYPRDEAWCNDGEMDNISSPSYYIDENAVICLDGDGCKIRNGSASIDENPNLDTSIACDSCDIWYHAFCVGFDPDGSSEDAWFCARCVSNERPVEADAMSLGRRNNEHGPEIADSECLAEAALSGNFSVSVADDGETAIVISMVKGNTWPGEMVENSLSSNQLKNNTNHVHPDMATPHDADITQWIPEEEDLKQSLSLVMSSTLPAESKSLPLTEFMNSNTDQVAMDVNQQFPEEESMDVASISGEKRKHSDFCSEAQTNADDDETEAENENTTFSKKSRVGEKVEMVSMEQNITSLTDIPKLPSPEQLPKAEDLTIDILSIVKGTGRKPSKRVKKIKRTVADNKESTILVEKLRKEIREAVRNKSTNDIGEKLFDPKLLAAFRAAVAGPKSEPAKKLSPLALKAKKSMLQKGKVRENLTKKIYADSNGKRRRAWDRDCEIEFWKHRCMRATKPEKVDTLKSVLSLLRKNPEDHEMKPSSESQASNPILSRLYLADTSVFPRKDNIRPLLAPKGTGNSDNDAKRTDANKVLSRVDDPKGNSFRVTGSNGPASDRAPSREGPSTSGDTKTSQKETSGKLDDPKKDKRQWALEVLARKKSLAGNTGKEKEGDNPMLNKNYPLLAQLPAEMRPVLATSRHKKIPVSVRQAQLYRLTEHFLKKADLPVIRRTAATELAVADAVNIEKLIADKSNSKVVYLNLCSQEMLQKSEDKPSDQTTETESNSSPPPLRVPADGLDQNAYEHLDHGVLEALRTAGLLSDSPPNTPRREAEVPNEMENSSQKNKEEGPDNILEIDSHLDVDIYGDFEYDLDDQECVGVTTTKALKTPQEEGESKVKLVFSTFIPERTLEDPKCSGDEEIAGDSQGLLNTQTGIGKQTSTKKNHDPSKTLCEEEVEELSPAECNELYGPENLSMMNKSPEDTSRKLHGSTDAAEDRIPENSDNNLVNQQVKCPDSGSESNVHCEIIASNFENSIREEKFLKKIQTDVSSQRKEKKSNTNHHNKQSDSFNSSVSMKVEAYIKEHIRPLCKSGVITVDQYRWAVSKTTEKVMKYHVNAKNASFLIKEGEKVKKLAEQYLEAAPQKDK